MLRVVILLCCVCGGASGEWVVAGYLGAAQTHDTTVFIEQPGISLRFEDLPFSGRSFQSPVYYGYRAGAFITRRFGLEGEFVHLKVYGELDEPVGITGRVQRRQIAEVAPMRAYADQFEVSHGLNLVFGNLVFRQPVLDAEPSGQGTLVVVVRAGAGFTVPRPSTTILGAASGQYELGPVAIQAAAGMEVRIWRGLHVVGEYKFTYTPSRFSVAAGEAEMQVRSHHVIAGLAVHF
jgi:hypothetical protein